jgi:hypothetical protein
VRNCLTAQPCFSTGFNLKSEQKRNIFLNHSDKSFWLKDWIAEILQLKPLQRPIVLPRGQYQVQVAYNFRFPPSSKTNFKKTFVMISPSYLGGRMTFLIAAYAVTGAASFLLGLFLIGVHAKRGSRIPDLIKIDRDTPYLHKDAKQPPKDPPILQASA